MLKIYMLTTKNKKKSALSNANNLSKILDNKIILFEGITADDDKFESLPKKNARPMFNGRNYLTPGEICCGYGHFLILQHHYKNFPKHNILVLEDDVFIRKNFERNKNLFFNKIKQNLPLILFGGQQGLKLELYFYFRSFLHNLNLNEFEKRHVYRTCCYYLSSSAVEIFYKTRKVSLNICVDDWSELSKRTSMPINFINLFFHPRDFSNSLIQIERLRNKT